MTGKNSYKQRLSLMVLKESIWEIQDSVNKLLDVHIEHEKILQVWREQIKDFSSRLTKLENNNNGR